MRKTCHHFVFVHGASHGAWCWFKVRTLLEALGHKVTCIDLKGAGINQTDPNTVFTMDDYNQPLSDFMSRLSDDNNKVILVGHSIGGSSVTRALCEYTSKVSMAIYLAAFMLPPDAVAPEIIDYFRGRKGATREEEVYEYVYEQGIDQEPTGMLIKQEHQRARFYNQSPEQDSVMASMLLRAAPYRALQQVADLPEASAEAMSVPRVYMKTMDDQSFPPSLQDAMIAIWPPDQVYELQYSDHSAFFSNPTALFGDLINAATSII